MFAVIYFKFKLILTHLIFLLKRNVVSNKLIHTHIMDHLSCTCIYFLYLLLLEIKCFLMSVFKCIVHNAPWFPVFCFIRRSSQAVRQQWLSPFPCTVSFHLEIGSTKTEKVGQRSTQALVRVSTTPYKYRSKSAFCMLKSWMKSALFRQLLDEPEYKIRVSDHLSENKPPELVQPFMVNWRAASQRPARCLSCHLLYGSKLGSEPGGRRLLLRLGWDTSCCCAPDLPLHKKVIQDNECRKSYIFSQKKKSVSQV